MLKYMFFKNVHVEFKVFFKTVYVEIMFVQTPNICMFSYGMFKYLYAQRIYIEKCVDRTPV